MKWADVEPRLRERAYRAISRDPRLLFEQDGGPVDLDADLFHARLVGFEDEIVTDMWVPEAMPTIVLPIRRSLLADAGQPTYALAPSPVARYELQSGYATLSVSAEHHPPVTRLRHDSTARVAYLRYRRRS